MKPHFRLPLLAFASLLALAALALVPGGAAAATKKNLIYVSLGDSLSVGYQKKPDGTVILSQTGYSENLLAKGSKTYPKLKLKKLGCPGEDTTTFQRGGRANCKIYPTGSQLKEAVKYLKRNRRKLAFVTVSIGANNFTPCAPEGGVDVACVAAGQAKLEKDMPKIFKALRTAAGPKVRIAALAPYNPFLAFYLKGTPTDYGIAELSIALAKQIRDTIAGAAAKQKIRLADAFKAFETTRFTELTPLGDGRTVPIAVAKICALTFMCSPAPQGPDIHPNDAGYGVLGVEFARALGLK